MSSRDEQILGFLRERAEGAVLEKTLVVIDQLRDELEVCENPRFEDLVRRRILASTSLSRKMEERGEWDESNAFVARQIEVGRTLDFGAVCELNGRITSTEGVVRGVSVYAGGEEYLSVGSIADSLLIFDEILLVDDAVLRASLIYIFVINVHPFLNGNGRTARLAADWVLLDNGLPPFCFTTAVQSHVAYAQHDRFLSMSECVLRCYMALVNSFLVLLGRV